MNIIGYGCYTAAGRGAHALYRGLLAGHDYCRPLSPGVIEKWPATPMTGARLCPWPDQPPGASQKEHLSQALLWCLEEMEEGFAASRSVLRSERLGVIFASTKGCIEDVVWQERFANDDHDTLMPVLNHFVEQAQIRPKLSLAVSNACSSVHGAAYLAKTWMKQKRVDHVLIVAADSIGPFVVNGFSALKTFAETWVTPFAKDRQGIQIGEAACAILLSSKVSSSLRIKSVAIESDGFAATRSDQTGSCLERVVLEAIEAGRPDLVVAHATGTVANDVVEDAVYSRVFGQEVPVTCTKWSVGHGLGASGGVDLIAALEVLRHQKVFAIANTEEADPSFKGRYLLRDASPDQGPVRTVLTSTMGFGGMHGAMLIGLGDQGGAHE